MAAFLETSAPLISGTIAANKPSDVSQENMKPDFNADF